MSIDRFLDFIWIDYLFSDEIKTCMFEILQILHGEPFSKKLSLRVVQQSVIKLLKQVCYKTSLNLKNICTYNIRLQTYKQKLEIN